MRRFRTEPRPLLLERGPGFYVMTCPYNEEFLAEFKLKIPPKERKWRGDKQNWTVYENKETLDILQGLGNQFFGGCEISDLETESPRTDDYSRQAPGARTKTVNSVSEAYTTIFSQATLDELADLIKVMRKRLHPDISTGDAERMAQINSAWDYIKNPCQ